jgi:hypothetical protein
MYKTVKHNKRAAHGKVSHNKSSGFRGNPNPPQWSSTIKTSYKQRFIAQNNMTGRQITNVELLDLKCVATAATVAYRLLYGMKINSIELWAANSSAIASNTIEVEWYTNNPAYGADSKIFTDTAVGTTNVAYVRARPPKGSFSGAWLPYLSTSYAVFDITCPEGTVIDIDFTISFIDDESAIAVTAGAVAGAVVGTLYTRYLDSASVPPLLAPVATNVI